MKLRPMTWGWWVELIFGAVPAVFFVLPSVFLSYAYGTLLWKQITDSDSGFIAGLVAGSIQFLGFLAGMVFVGAVICLLCLILFGVEQINRRPLLRFFSIGTGVPGLLIASYAVFAGSQAAWRDFLSRGFSPILGELVDWGGLMMGGSNIQLLTLIGPIVVGLRYLPKLIRG